MRAKLINFIDQFPNIALILRGLYNEYFGEDEINLIKTIKKFSANSDCIGIDVGANKGVYTYQLQKFCRFTISFEPNECLKNFWRSICSKNFICFPYAVGSQNSFINIYTPKNKSGTLHTRSTAVDSVAEVYDTVVTKSVQQVCMDSLLPILPYSEKVQYIVKIDVEGYEQEVVNGATNFIEIYAPVFLIEVESRHNPSYDKVFQFFKSKQYKSYYYCKGKIVKCDEKIINSQKSERKSLNYINNFIFLKVGEKGNPFHKILERQLSK